MLSTNEEANALYTALHALFPCVQVSYAVANANNHAILLHRTLSIAQVYIKGNTYTPRIDKCIYHTCYIHRYVYILSAIRNICVLIISETYMVSTFVLVTDNVCSNKIAREHLTQLKQEQMHILTTGIQLNTPPTEVAKRYICSVYVVHSTPFFHIPTPCPLELVHRCYL